MQWILREWPFLKGSHYSLRTWTSCTCVYTQSSFSCTCVLTGARFLWDRSIHQGTWPILFMIISQQWTLGCYIIARQIGPISSSCEAQKFAYHEISFLIKTGLPTKFPFVACCFLTGIQLSFACPENQVEIWLAFLFLSREKLHANQICVL